MSTELNRQIAEKVFGLIPCRGEHKSDEICYSPAHDPNSGTLLQDYSGDHYSAWSAAERIKLFDRDTVSLIRNGNGLWEIRDIDYQAGDWRVLAAAETIPMALCLATLEVVKAASAPAAPPQNLGPTMIQPLVNQSFKGKSFVQTMLEKILPDAKEKSRKKTSAPAASPKNPIWHCAMCHDAPKIKLSDLCPDGQDAKKKSKKKASAPAAPPQNSATALPEAYRKTLLAAGFKKGLESHPSDAKKKSKKKTSAPAAPRRISKEAVGKVRGRGRGRMKGKKGK